MSLTAIRGGGVDRKGNHHSFHSGAVSLVFPSKELIFIHTVKTVAPTGQRGSQFGDLRSSDSFNSSQMT